MTVIIALTCVLVPSKANVRRLMSTGKKLSGKIFMSSFMRSFLLTGSQAAVASRSLVAVMFWMYTSGSSRSESAVS